MSYHADIRKLNKLIERAILDGRTDEVERLNIIKANYQNEHEEEEKQGSRA